jgi:Uma2 family endonuclease
MSDNHGAAHQIVSLRIAAALLMHAESAGLGQVLQAPFDVILSRACIIQPDISFVEIGRSGLIGKTNLWGAPDIAIEVLSESTRDKDLRAKRNIYSHYRIKEYWIADPDARTIEVLSWSEWGYATAGVYRAKQFLASPAIPTFRLPLREIFKLRN